MKRIISLLMAVALCFGLLPAFALGAGSLIQVRTEPVKKISFSLLQALAEKTDDELTHVSIWLQGPSPEEIEAEVPMEKPDPTASQAEQTAYTEAYYRTKIAMYSELADIFALKFLDETEEVLTKMYDEAPNLQVNLRKSRIAELAALDKVIWINEFGSSVIVVQEPTAAEKTTESLHEAMDDAQENARFTVRIWLRGWSNEEFSAAVPAAYPTFTSTPEEIQAYLDAREQTAQQVAAADDLFFYELFANNHKDDFDRILYQSKKMPVMVVTASKAKINALASAQMVSKIDPAFGYEEALPDPELPEDPDALKKIEKSLREFMGIAAHDELIPVSITLKETAEIAVLTADDGNPDGTAKNEALRQAYTALTSDFVENHLDPTDEVFLKGKYSPFVTAEVPKYKIAGLAALDEVTSIGWAVGHDDPVYSEDGDLVILPAPREAAANDKLDAYLIEQMEAAADDEIISVAVWLKSPSDEEIEAMIPVPYPGDGASLEKLQEYYSAKRRVQQEVYSAISSGFAENHLDESNPIYYCGQFIPKVNFGATKAQIFALAELDEVKQIDWIDDPYVPVNPLTPKENLEKALAEAKAIDLSQYTEESAAAIREHIVIAEAVLAQADAPQEALEAAVKMLEDDLQSLIPYAQQPVTRDLARLLAQAEAIDPGRYTEESVAALALEIEKAKYILAKKDATQAEIDAAYALLQDALSILKDAEPPQFEDVRDPKAFYYNAVYWAYDHTPQITNGMDETHFRPELFCTRAQVVTFLWRAAGCPEPANTQTTFTDLRPGAYYTKAVAWAVENGISKGVAPDMFAPDWECGRGQIVTMIWRLKGEPEPTMTQSPFIDMREGMFYYKAGLWALENQVTNGMTATTFAPGEYCTRGQVVTFLYRAMGNMN